MVLSYIFLIQIIFYYSYYHIPSTYNSMIYFINLLSFILFFSQYTFFINLFQLYPLFFILFFKLFQLLLYNYVIIFIIYYNFKIHLILTFFEFIYENMKFEDTKYAYFISTFKPNNQFLILINNNSQLYLEYVLSLNF